MIGDLAKQRGDRLVKLSEDARDIRRRLEEQIFDLGQNYNLGMGFASYIRKLPRQWGSLTLVLGHIIKDKPEIIGWQAAELAENLIIELMQWHAIRFYQWLDGGSGNLEMTRAIAGWLLLHRYAKITSSDLTRNVHACRAMDGRELQRAVALLVSWEWLTPHSEINPRSWDVNPAIYTQFADRAEDERYRRAQMQELIRRDGAQRRSPKVATIS